MRPRQRQNSINEDEASPKRVRRGDPFSVVGKPLTTSLRAGAPMSEVAQLLRHVDQATSSIYAAADAEAVASLAQPWPEVR